MLGYASIAGPDHPVRGLPSPEQSMTGDRSNERHPTTGSFDFQQDRDTSRADRYWARTHFKCTDAGVPIGGTSEMKVGDPFGYQSDPPMTAVRKPIPFGGLQLGLYQRR